MREHSHPYLHALWLSTCLTVTCLGATTDGVVVPNGDFEKSASDGKSPEGWTVGIAPNTKATIELDPAVAHSGRSSIRLVDQSPTQPFIYAVIHSPKITVRPETTYDIRFFARATNATGCSVGADLDVGDVCRENLPVGSYDWQLITFTVTTQPDETELTIHFLADGLTEGLWIDDVSIAASPRQIAGLSEVRYPKDFSGPFPRTPDDLPERLLVCDATKLPDETYRWVVALEGIVNRKGPRVYLINKVAHEPGIWVDEQWLAYMKQRGYTGEEERLADPEELVRRFRDEIAGLVVFDPELPGSINASWMLAGLKNCLPVSPETAASLGPRLGLRVVMDLRGMWKRNVEAYRYVYDRYWDQMCHHVLAWQFPPSRRFCTQDYLVEFKVFQFWVSNPDDKEKGGDPKAEMAFAHEILANTPANIPMMGWVGGDDPKYVWLTEYTFSHLVSEYGKFIPGSDLDCNISVHSAFRPDGGLFRQKSRRQPSAVKLENDKAYVSFSIMEGIDALNYWQGYQRKMWADPQRGQAPMGFGMNPMLNDVMPLVQQYYYETMTANESFFAMVYLNEPVYANRFRKSDRERIWSEWLRSIGDYCRRLDMDGVEVCWSGVGRRNLPADGILGRYCRALPEIDYLIADCGAGNRATIPSDACASLVDGKVVFHTLNHYHVWSANENMNAWPMDRENERTLQEIQRLLPHRRPAFASTVGTSWVYRPSWVADLQRKMPPSLVLVSPRDLARLYRESRNAGAGNAK